MTARTEHAGARREGVRTRRLVLASRGDALTPYLAAALEHHYPVARLDPELRPWQRYVTAAATVRPTRTAWVEAFYKSGLAYSLRTANARRGLRDRAVDPVLQVHALFEVPGATALLYVDCTHRQAAEQWPAWNPLRGPALQRWYDRETRAYRSAAHLFAFSHATARSLVQDYGVPADRVSVVGAGINAYDLPRPEPRTDAPPTVLFVGNDFARKGGPVLLEAFRQVRHEVPDARLLLVGATPPVAPQAGVEVLGRVHDRDRLHRLYRSSTAFCLPSLFDPFPLVLLEAMAHGMPVVATPTCGVPDLVDDGRHALLVPPGDPVALATALVSVLTDRARSDALGAAARARVVERFTWEQVVQRMAPVLDRVLAA